jgi:hypothetical protein
MRPTVNRDRQPDIVRRRRARRVPVVAHVDPRRRAAARDLELVRVLGVVRVGGFGGDVARAGPGAGEGGGPEDFVGAGVMGKEERVWG